jgi:hypothetical protein
VLARQAFYHLRHTSGLNFIFNILGIVIVYLMPMCTICIIIQILQHVFLFFVFWTFFETGSSYVAQAGLKLLGLNELPE